MSDPGAEIEAVASAEEERSIGIAEDQWYELVGPDTEPLDMDPAKVNRTLKALAHAQRRLAEYDAAANDEHHEQAQRHQAERAELEDRLNRGRDPLAQSVDHLAHRLELVGLARIAADPGEGTWTLPAGRLAVGGGGIEKVWPSDEAALIAWAEKHAPDAVEPQPSKLNKNKLWAAVKDHAVKEEHRRQVPATESGAVRTPAGGVVPGLTVASKPRTVTPQPDLDAF